MKWYECRIKCDFVSKNFMNCRKLDDGGVVFFDGGLGWFIVDADRAREIADLKGPSLFSDEIEEHYRYAQDRRLV
jgi:hypothetical protein